MGRRAFIARRFFWRPFEDCHPDPEQGRRGRTCFRFPSPAVSGILTGVTLSVVIITHNEEANIGRTLASVQALVLDGKGEIIVVDSGSTDRTVEIAKSFGAQVFIEEWKGYAAQKNSAIDKAEGDWILSLDADEELESSLTGELLFLFSGGAPTDSHDARLERVKRLTYLSSRQTRR